MNKKHTIGVFIIFLLLVIPCTSGSFSYVNRTSSVLENPLLEGSSLKIIDNVKVLTIRGSHYQMGYQHGFLLHDAVRENIRGFLNSSTISMTVLLETWDTMKNYVPDEYIQEIQGIADGSGLSFDQVIAGYMLITREDMGCFGISAWGDATVDGKLYHLRSFDQPMNIKDPETGVFAHDNSVLIVRIPDEGIPSIIPSIAGSLHGGGGMNAEGIALGQQVCWSNDQTFEGTPALFKTQMVLDNAGTINEALTVLTTNKTLGWNYIVSDSKIPIGYVVEITANHQYIGTWDNPIEKTYPFWQIKDIVRRTNFFIEPAMAATQRETYNPSSISEFIKLLYRTDIFYAIWRSYKANSEDLMQNWGDLDLDTMMTMFRNGYKGKTDLLLRIIVILAQGTSFNRAWNIWCGDPSTGDILVSFAENDKIAFDTQVHSFNLFELIG